MSATLRTVPPNILFIQTDQHLRSALGCYGNPLIRTPNLDRLAAEGIRFDRHFTCTGVCTPARGALLSGMYPHRSGMIFNPELPGNRVGARLCEFDRPVIPFSKLLREQGYDLYHIGKWHIGSWFESRPSHAGFRGVFHPGYGYPARHPHFLRHLARFGLSEFRLKKRPPLRDDGWAYFSEQVGAPPEASIPGYLCDQAVRTLRRTARSAEPFFLGLNFWGPHIPVNIPAAYLDLYDPAEVPLPANWRNIRDRRPEIVDKAHRLWGGHVLDENAVRRIIAAYYGYVTLIDEQLGRVFETLRATGQADRTVIVFTTDHGSTLGDHGLQDKGLMMYDEVYHIPLIIAGGPVARRGATFRNFTLTMDLTATFVDLAGAMPPPEYDGLSLKPVIEGDLRRKTRREVVCEAFGHQVPFVQRMIRDTRFKYIFNTAAMDEFYDVRTDPGERRNLIGSVEPRLLQRYRRRLAAWGRATDDHVAARFLPGVTRRALGEPEP